MMSTLSLISYLPLSSGASWSSSLEMGSPFFSHSYSTSGIPNASQVQVKSSLSSTCMSPMEIVNTGLKEMKRNRRRMNAKTKYFLLTADVAAESMCYGNCLSPSLVFSSSYHAYVRTLFWTNLSMYVLLAYMCQWLLLHSSHSFLTRISSTFYC